MKAIETRYKGYRFRSRLEARWAVFFDALGVAWEYEPEGFELGGGVRYLPDFRILAVADPRYLTPWKRAHWIEVKPVAPNPHEVEKLSSVCFSHKSWGTVLHGTPGEHGLVAIRERRVLPAPWSVPKDVGSRELVQEAMWWRGAPYDGARHPALVGSSITAARSARFEFGESGARA